jgi:hypothetical protein
VSQNPSEVLIVNADVVDARCPDGELIRDCEFGRLLLKNALVYKPDDHLTATDEMRRANHLHYLRSKCEKCGHIGSVVLDMDGRATIRIDLLFSQDEKILQIQRESSDNIDSH